MVQTCIWFKEELGQFSVGQTAQSLTCSIMEKPCTGLDDCLRMLLSCFRKRLSVAVSQSGVFVDARNFTVEGRGDVGIDWERES